MAKKSMTEKVRSTFDHDNVQVNPKLQRIEVYWMRSPEGRLWVPYSGGPLYGEQAKETARWLGTHIEKAIRDWPIVVGELDTRTFPGVFSVA